MCVCGGGSDGEVSVCACVFQSKTAGTCLQVGCVEAALMLKVEKHYFMKLIFNMVSVVHVGMLLGVFFSG